MWLFLCHTDDLPALWAHNELKARGLAPVELVSAESLAFSLRWEHRIESNHGASFRITLADGRQVTSDRIFGALNRIQFAPVHHWRKAETKNREYVEQEMLAFYTSWLHTLSGPVLNPVTANGLSGAWRRSVEWIRLANLAGLTTRDYDSNTPGFAQVPSHTVIMAGGEVSANGFPPYVLEGCHRLSKLSHTPLLGVDFEIRKDGHWVFANANPTPDLRLGGKPFINTLYQIFKNRGSVQ